MDDVVNQRPKSTSEVDFASKVRASIFGSPLGKREEKQGKEAISGNGAAIAIAKDSEVSLTPTLGVCPHVGTFR